jgi:hypothetical protein
MSAKKDPGRQGTTEEKVPDVQWIDGALRIVRGADHLELTLHEASGLTARIAEKLAAVAKLQTN